MTYLVKLTSRSTGAVDTHTSNLEKEKNKYKIKGNIILPCGFNDTG